MQINFDRKIAKYHSLISDLTPKFSTSKFINLSTSTLGLLGKSSDSLLSMLDNLKFDRPSSTHTIKKIMNIVIRCNYFNHYFFFSFVYAQFVEVVVVIFVFSLCFS